MKTFSFHTLLRLASLSFALLGPFRAGAAEYDQRLINLSTRAQIGTGSNSLIAGFVVGDGTPKTMLLRAVGPGLTGLGVTGVVTAPTLTLYNSAGVQLATNSGWNSADAATMTSVGAFGLTVGSKDAALVTLLPPGAYTAQVTSAGGAAGVALLEIYDVTGPAKLVNISTRAVVASGSATLIAGLVVAPGGTRHVLVRAAGPGLTDFGVTGANPDPNFTVIDGTGAQIAANDNWGTANANGQLTSAFTQGGAFGFAPGSKDAALVLDLAPGNYTIQVGGTGGATGVALVEIYDLTTGPTGSSSGTGTLYVAPLRATTAAAGAPGYGTATILLADDERTATVNMNFASLTAPEVTAHLVLDGNFVGALPSGQVTDYTWYINATGTYSAADIVAALKAGRVTVRIDTASYPAGELTGGFVRGTGGVFVVPAAPPAVDLSKPTPQGAARLLQQATFGPTQSDITYLMQKGYTAWIDEQFTFTQTKHQSALVSDFVANNIGGQGTPEGGYYPYPGGSHRQAAWWKVSLTGTDQLRQRVAFALSEIFVVSDQDANLNPWQEPLAHYYDLLAADAFGNYRQLLEDVTLSPIMGVYLSSLRNGSGAVDPNGVPISSPDENYAREVMQLFSIGLQELNPDGTLKLGANGLPVATYDQDTIVETAKVFTGWAFSSTLPNPGFRTTGGTSTEDWMRPMMLYPDFHDNSAKTIIGGKVLPAGQGGTKDLKDTLDALFNHPNTAPFVSRLLIQRLVTSNPSPGYVYRIAQVFANNGAGVRGDLKAVVRALLLDYEARSPDMLARPGHGKLKEPLLRATAFMRAFGAKSDSGRYNIDAYPAFTQAALRAPTVFNFFLPDYTRMGPLAGAGLYAPEFQILTDTTAITSANFYRLYIDTPKPAIPAADNRETVYLTLDSLIPLASTPQPLVDQLNLLIAAGTMSKPATDRIVAALNEMPANTDPYERVRTALFLAVVAPEAASQK